MDATAKPISAGATGQIVASRQTLYGYDVLNTTAAPRFLQIYNSTSTTFGSQGTPIVTIPIAAGAKAQLFGDMGMGVVLDRLAVRHHLGRGRDH